jgi:hypothetical protein
MLHCCLPFTCRLYGWFRLSYIVATWNFLRSEVSSTDKLARCSLKLTIALRKFFGNELNPLLVSLRFHKWKIQHDVVPLMGNPRLPMPEHLIVPVLSSFPNSRWKTFKTGWSVRLAMLTPCSRICLYSSRRFQNLRSSPTNLITGCTFKQFPLNIITFWAVEIVSFSWIVVRNKCENDSTRSSRLFRSF